jgi:hypothetical protein
MDLLLSFNKLKEQIFSFIQSNFKKFDFFSQILNQELDFVVGTRSDTKLCQVLDQEPKTFPGTRSSSSGTKLSTLIEICFFLSYLYYLKKY